MKRERIDALLVRLIFLHPVLYLISATFPRTSSTAFIRRNIQHAVISLTALPSIEPVGRVDLSYFNGNSSFSRTSSGPSASYSSSCTTERNYRLPRFVDNTVFASTAIKPYHVGERYREQLKLFKKNCCVHLIILAFCFIFKIILSK
jgi:hypothetical protein